MSMLPSHAPSIRAKAFRLPPASTTAMSIKVPISSAFLMADSTAALAWSRLRSLDQRAAILHPPFLRTARFGEQGPNARRLFVSWWLTGEEVRRRARSRLEAEAAGLPSLTFV